MDNFVHADLHPGNILVQEAKHFGGRLEDQATIMDLFDTLILELQPSCPPFRLVLLDAGIVAELQDADRDNFQAVFTAVVLGQVRPDFRVILSWCARKKKLRVASPHYECHCLSPVVQHGLELWLEPVTSLVTFWTTFWFSLSLCLSDLMAFPLSSLWSLVYLG